jgi:hypothetical protein
LRALGGESRTLRAVLWEEARSLPRAWMKKAVIMVLQIWEVSQLNRDQYLSEPLTLKLDHIPPR